MTIWGVHLDGHEQIPVAKTLEALRALVDSKDLPARYERLKSFQVPVYDWDEEKNEPKGELLGLIQRYEWEGTDEEMQHPTWIKRGTLKWEI